VRLIETNISADRQATTPYDINMVS